ncbi:MAG: TIGR04255 family protein [Candidatus Electrothrix sp. AR4]|nr:TIGR04255 family protein [Candidatus Electrothrix sp. AR4]
MSKLENAPLVEVIFEIRWGKTTQKERELLVEFSQEEQSLMPGKFQLLAENEGFCHLEVLKNQPLLPHLVKYRYRKNDRSYPLYQLGNGIFTVNQIDYGKFEYEWKSFQGDIERGVKLLEKSYPYSIKELPLIDIQLRYRDVVLSNTNESLFDFINDKLEIGTFSLPNRLRGNKNIKTDLPMGSITLQVECESPKGNIICHVNPGKHNGEKAFILDFIVISKVNFFPEISKESLIDWFVAAHEHHQVIFNAFFNNDIMETFS